MSRRASIAVLAIAASAVVAARALAYFALGDVAHVQDEIAYLFQAKVFAAGRLTVPVVEPEAAFAMWFVDERGGRHAVFPPGWPVLLAAFVKAGLSRWVGPLLHGATVILVARAGERVGGPRAAVFSAALYAASPQAVVLAASLMSHALVALAAAAVVACVLAPSSRARGVAIGAAIGVAIVTRPLGAVAIAIGGGVLALGAARGAHRPLRLAHVAIAAAASAPFAVALLAYNHALTGSALTFPQTAWFDSHLPPSDLPFFRYRPGCNDLGFGADRGCDGTLRGAHDLANALSNTGDNLTSWLLLSCGPSLVAGPALALARSETRRAAALLLALPAAAILLYMAYWHPGTAYGARFYHAGLPPMLVVVALAFARAAPGARVGIAALAATLAWDAYAYVPVVREIAHPRWGYWATDGRFAAIRRSWSERSSVRARSVVMVAFTRDELTSPRLVWTARYDAGTPWMKSVRVNAALAENQPFVDDGAVVFAKFHPALVPALRARFPDRALYLYVDAPEPERGVLAPYDPEDHDESARPPPPSFDGYVVEP